MKSANKSPRRGEFPSTFAVPARGKDRRLAAKERPAANDRSADQRCVYAEILAAREKAGPFLARALARRRMKLAASELQRSPTSRARTTSRARAALENTRYVLSLARRAGCKTAPSVRPALRRGAPAAVRGETRVVSTASRAPSPQRQPRLAMTSIRRSSCLAGTRLPPGRRERLLAQARRHAT